MGSHCLSTLLASAIAIAPVLASLSTNVREVSGLQYRMILKSFKTRLELAQQIRPFNWHHTTVG